MRKNNLTAALASYIKFYNKYNELTTKNSDFLNSLDEQSRHQLLEYYQNKVRIEVKLKAKKIKQLFKIDAVTLRNIIDSSINVLTTVLIDVFEPISNIKIPPQQKTASDLINHFFLLSHDKDLISINSYLDEGLAKGKTEKEKATRSRNINRKMQELQMIALSEPEFCGPDGLDIYRNLIKVLRSEDSNLIK